MSKADKMFEELGYRKETRYPYIYYINPLKSFGISFLDGKRKEYQRHNHAITTIEEHLAIHEKMKELGWIE